MNVATNRKNNKNVFIVFEGFFELKDKKVKKQNVIKREIIYKNKIFLKEM